MEKIILYHCQSNTSNKNLNPGPEPELTPPTRFKLDMKLLEEEMENLPCQLRDPGKNPQRSLFPFSWLYIHPATKEGTKGYYNYIDRVHFLNTILIDSRMAA